MNNISSRASCDAKKATKIKKIKQATKKDNKMATIKKIIKWQPQKKIIKWQPQKKDNKMATRKKDNVEKPATATTSLLHWCRFAVIRHLSVYENCLKGFYSKARYKLQNIKVRYDVRQKILHHSIMTMLGRCRCGEVVELSKVVAQLKNLKKKHSELKPKVELRRKTQPTN